MIILVHYVIFMGFQLIKFSDAFFPVGRLVQPRWKQIVNELPKCIQDIMDFGVRNCTELVSSPKLCSTGVSILLISEITGV